MNWHLNSFLKNLLELSKIWLLEWPCEELHRPIPWLKNNECYTKTVEQMKKYWVASNPCYSGGRNRENCSLKPAQANSLRDPISRKPTTKQGWQSGSSGIVPAQQVWSPEFKSQYGQKKEKKENLVNLIVALACYSSLVPSQVLFFLLVIDSSPFLRYSSNNINDTRKSR
jgi:hypothetical protein